MSIYDTLNKEQQKAVFTTSGPVLILAGAGSGKTRALTHRIAYLIEEEGVNPWNILALTFTNKAAGEMRERVDNLVGFGADSIWVSTFHSTCVRILRRHIEVLGYTTNFSIYDSDDQKTLMRQVIKKMDLDGKIYKEKSMIAAISSCKDQLITPEEFAIRASGEYRQMKIAEIYQEYQAQLKKNNALDFDDLIVKTIELFQTSQEVLDYYQNRFRYLMVDEYQDTNYAQFKLISILASKYRNLCVVGDDDQSIYKFRGADIENILGFEDTFPDAKVIKLEQNYRSTSNILDAANGVICNNAGRKDKRLWTSNGTGEKVKFRQFDTSYQEAEAVVRDIQKAVLNGEEYSDCAVLYRTNAQSRLLEEKCVAYSVPYRLVGGVNFYQRKEIKDILSYLKTIDNAQDDLASQRIINTPKRGIGATSIGKIMTYAVANQMGFYEACRRAERIPTIGKAKDRIEVFVQQIQAFRSKLEYCSVSELIEDILESTGYRKELLEDDEIEGQTRLENIEELKNKAAAYEEEEESPTLSGFLEEVALVADIDNMDESENRVVLMTLHSAKGLEFPRVYMTGMEDGLFPGMMSINSDDDGDLEEERRLCYVGITRAKKNLVLTAARQRMVNGETRMCKVSRFINEIPEEFLDKGKERSRYSAGYGMEDEDNKEYSFSSGYGQSFGNGNFNKVNSTVFDLNKDSEKAHGLSEWKAPKGSYSSPKDSSVQMYMGKQFTVTKSTSLSYGVGDRVRHVKFGEGTVIAITEQKKDFEVTVNFDVAGQKRMYAAFAKLTKL